MGHVVLRVTVRNKPSVQVFSILLDGEKEMEKDRWILVSAHVV